MDAEALLKDRKSAYTLTFGDESGQAVLQDLAKFCRANESCFHADPRLHALMEGRREVWLRIVQHLNLTEQELFRLFNPTMRNPRHD